MSDDAVTTTKLTTDEIISRLRAMPSATRLAAAERLEMLVSEQDAFISSINEAQDEIDDAQVEMERLAAERDALRAAIVEAHGCFDAALFEGWIEALAEGDIDRIRDLWTRRISFAAAALADQIAKTEGG